MRSGLWGTQYSYSWDDHVSSIEFIPAVQTLLYRHYSEVGHSNTIAHPKSFIQNQLSFAVASVACLFGIYIKRKIISYRIIRKADKIA